MKVCLYAARRTKSLLMLMIDARRYFKQSEIVLFRLAPEGMPLAQEQNKQIAVS